MTIARSALMSTLAAAVLLAASPALSADVKGRKALGYAQAIGGPSGLAFQFGVTNHLMAEGIVGLQYFDFDDADTDAEFWLELSLGAHFQVLQAESAAFTAGGRLNVLTGPAGVAEDMSKTDVTQFGVDIPTRVYWWPTKYISLHAETGVSFLFGPEDAVINGAPGLTAKGMAINVFSGFEAGAFGNLGMSFWW